MAVSEFGIALKMFLNRTTPAWAPSELKLVMNVPDLVAGLFTLLNE